jgi:beta-N-acetylhexosaminidase
VPLSESERTLYRHAGHLTVPGLTEEGLPTSLSPAAITGLLRGELGYTDALVLSDALEMGAVGRVATVPEAAVLALVAGADVALYSGTALTGAVIGVGSALWWSWQLSLWLLGAFGVGMLALLGWLARIDMSRTP